MNERSVDGDRVRADRLAEVDQPRQWAYLLAVIAGGLVLMLALIAVLGAT